MPEKKYRIAHTEASKGLGGQEMRIVKECQELQKRGHTVEIICQPDAGIIPLAQENGIPLHLLPMRSSGDLAAIFHLIRHFRSERIDIVHSHSSVDCWLGGIAGRLARVPLLARTRHVSIPVRNRFGYRYLSDLLTTTGFSIRKMFIEDLKIPEERVFSVPTGIDLDAFNPDKYDRMTVRRELNIPEDVPVISIVGVLRWWKGHHFFIEAARKILAKRKMVFLIVGHSPAGKIDLGNLLDGVEGDFRVLGYRKDIAEILSATDILVSASVGGEGVSQSILQALAMKKGVVATNAGSSSEVVRNEETGLLVPPSDGESIAVSIERLIDEEGLIGRLGSNGRKLVEENHSISKMADDMEALYHRFFPKQVN